MYVQASQSVSPSRIKFYWYLQYAFCFILLMSLYYSRLLEQGVKSLLFNMKNVTEQLYEQLCELVSELTKIEAAWEYKDESCKWNEESFNGRVLLRCTKQSHLPACFNTCRHDKGARS